MGGPSLAVFVTPNSFGDPHSAFKPRVSHVSEPDRLRVSARRVDGEPPCAPFCRPFSHRRRPSSSPPAPRHRVPDIGYPEIGFRDREPIRIAAGALEIVDLYRPPLAAPHVEHLSPAIPGIVFARWARRRLAPVGGPARIVVTIAEAQIVETLLATDDSLQGAVTVGRRRASKAAARWRSL